MEGGVVVQGRRAPEDAVVEERSVDLSLARRSVQLDVRHTTAEKVGAVHGSRIGNVRWLAEDASEGRAAVRRFVETDLRFPGRREAPAVHGRRAMPRNICADEDMVGVGRVDRDCAD